MTPVGRCGRSDCPVPTPHPDQLKGLRTRVFDAGATWHRGVSVTHPDPTKLVPGIGNTRFAPLAGVAHAYVASTSIATLLESAFHEVTPTAPRLYQVQLNNWSEERVAQRYDVRLIDLTDDELARMGMARHQLVATGAIHYPCTRAWAETLHGRSVGGHKTHGVFWQSRQLELQTAAIGHRPALRDLFSHHPAIVAVLWSPPAEDPPFTAATGGLGPLNGPAAAGYVDDLAALLGIAIE